MALMTAQQWAKLAQEHPDGKFDVSGSFDSNGSLLKIYENKLSYAYEIQQILDYNLSQLPLNMCFKKFLGSDYNGSLLCTKFIELGDDTFKFNFYYEEDPYKITAIGFYKPKKNDVFRLQYAEADKELVKLYTHSEYLDPKKYPKRLENLDAKYCNIISNIEDHYSMSWIDIINT